MRPRSPATAGWPLLALLAALLPAAARAEEAALELRLDALAAAAPAPPADLAAPEPEAPPGEEAARSGPGLARLAWFAGGAATGFAAHEGCHLAANLALGNVPHLSRVEFLGALPFFTIDHGITCRDGRCSRRDGSRFGPGRPGLYAILSAGFQCQHLADEVLLTRQPDLRRADAPFLTGMLAFNTLVSVAYVTADWAGLEPAEGDLQGLRRDARAPRHVLNGLLLGAAVLDVARYLWPEVGWLAWASRGVKVGVGGIIFTL